MDNWMYQNLLKEVKEGNEETRKLKEEMVGTPESPGIRQRLASLEESQAWIKKGLSGFVVGITTAIGAGLVTLLAWLVGSPRK